VENKKIFNNLFYIESTLKHHNLVEGEKMSNFLSDLFNAMGNMGGSMIGLKLSRWVNMDEDDAKQEIEDFVVNASKSQLQDLEMAFKGAMEVEYRPFRREQLASYYSHFRDALTQLQVSQQSPSAIYNITNSGSLNLNVAATLSNVSQTINQIPYADSASKNELAGLISKLQQALQRVPSNYSDEADTVAEYAKTLLEDVSNPSAKKTRIQITKDGLLQAAKNISGIMPTILEIAYQILRHPLINR